MPSKSKSTRSQARAATVTASNNGTSILNADTNTLLREMHGELILLRAAQTVTNDQVKEMRDIQNSAIENLRAELEVVQALLNTTTKKLVDMENTQKDLIRRLQSFEGAASATPPPAESTEPLSSTAQSPTTHIPRPLRREGAFISLRDLKRRNPYSGVYGREGPATHSSRSTPESATRSPPADLEEAQGSRITFPTSSERDNNSTGNTGGRKRTRDDMDPPPVASTSHDNTNSHTESAHSPPKRRRGMDGERVVDLLSPQPRRPSVGDMAHPSVISPPRPDTPRPAEVESLPSHRS